MSLSSKPADFPQRLRISQEWLRFCLIQTLECRRLGMCEAKKGIAALCTHRKAKYQVFHAKR